VLGLNGSANSPGGAFPRAAAAAPRRPGGPCAGPSTSWWSS